jgi:hypothetical protein
VKRHSTAQWLCGAALFLVGLDARANCPAPVTASELARHVSTAEGAYTSMEEQAFREAVYNARFAVPCLSEPITVSQAASYYKMEALSGFLDRDHALAVAAFRSLLSVEPKYLLPEVYASEDQPLRVDFEAATLARQVPGRPLPTVEGAYFLVNGKKSTTAPLEYPHVLQQVGVDGKVENSAAVELGAAPPAWSVEAAPEQASRDRSGRAKATVPLAVAGVASALVSGGLFLAADGRADAFWDAGTDSAELDALRRQTNGLSTMSAGLGLVAIGAGAAAVATVVW